ncbi:MAG TPA: tetratricopeptide repeat protein [Acidobacteriota bacterium]|jgi:outer membrane protein assembly factor BamD (BamD/ComL family)
MRAGIFALLFVFAFSALLFTADDPAKGHYDSALFFLQSEKYQQALDDLNFIVKSFPKSQLADDALLQLGIYYFDHEKKSDQALQYFQQIKDNYTESNSAPAAYYYIGLIYLDRRDPKDLDEAFANFERVTRVFPSSNWVDRSLVGAGLALKLRGEYDKAYEEFSKVKVRFAGSPLAPRAQYEMGLSALNSDSFIDAAYDFQQLINQFPDSEFSKPAREINTIIYRLHIAPQSDRKLYLPDSSYSVLLPQMDNPLGMGVDSKGNLYLADKDKKIVSVFDAAGKSTNSISLLSPQSIFIDDRDVPIIANETAVSVGGKESASFSFSKEGKAPEPLVEIRSAAMNVFGDFYVVSEKMPGILMYDSMRKPVSGSTFANTEREYAKVVLNSRNQVYALDKQRKQILLMGPDGKAIYAIGPTGKGYTFDRIEDFAVDRANHLYVLNRNPRGIMIFAPDGTILKFIPSEKKGGSLVFEDGRLIAVGPSGSIFILDRDQKRILKIG